MTVRTLCHISTYGKNLVAQRTTFLVTAQNYKKKYFALFQILGSKQTNFSFCKMLTLVIFSRFDQAPIANHRKQSC